MYVVDVDSVVDGSARRLVEDGRVAGRLLVHRIVVEYLYSEARKGLSHGFTGLDELSRLLDMSGEQVEVVVVDDEREPWRGAIDLDTVKRVVRRYAWKSSAILITSDKITRYQDRG